jgi:twinkle protein
MTQTHVLVVAHMKKGETEDKPSGKWGIKGSGGITDMADTVVEVWRNKPRERAIARAALPDATPLDEKFASQPDAMLLVHKQRATGKEPMVNLWFDPTTTQFLSGPDHTPRPMLEFSATAIAA